MTGTRRSLAVLLAAAVAGTGTGACSLVRRSRTFTAISSSMAPTIRPDERISCTRKPPERIERGDVVVFEGRGTGFAHEGEPESRVFLFRVVGLPGETISGAASGAVTVDGRALEEPYVDTPATSGFDPFIVPEAAYFVLGDNRDASSDSRYNGTVPHANVLASCTRIVSPRDRRGRIPGT